MCLKRWISSTGVRPACPTCRADWSGLIFGEAIYSNCNRPEPQSQPSSSSDHQINPAPTSFSPHCCNRVNFYPRTSTFKANNDTRMQFVQHRHADGRVSQMWNCLRCNRSVEAPRLAYRPHCNFHRQDFGIRIDYLQEERTGQRCRAFVCLASEPDGSITEQHILGGFSDYFLRGLSDYFIMFLVYL